MKRFEDLFDYGVDGPDDWMWCLHCEHVSRREDWESNGLSCPRPGCDGGALDAIPWSEAREANPDWPETPEHGHQYASGR